MSFFLQLFKTNVNFVIVLCLFDDESAQTGTRSAF